MLKKSIVLDFDGVLHSYTSRWMEADFIPDPPVEGAIEFLYELFKSDEFDVYIFSSRSNQDGGIRAMQNWVKHWALQKLKLEEVNHLCNELNKLEHIKMYGSYYHHFPLHKPPAHLTIDDRAINFTGKFPSFSEMRNFKPWNKK